MAWQEIGEVRVYRKVPDQSSGCLLIIILAALALGLWGSVR